MRTTEMVLIALFLKTSKFLPASVSIYIIFVYNLHVYILSLYITYMYILSLYITYMYIILTVLSIFKHPMNVKNG